MKFIALAVTIALTFAGAATAAQVPAPANPAPANPKVASPEPATNNCVVSSCPCNGIVGPFCGHEATNPACTNGHSFQCNSNGQACDLGVTASCV